MKCLTVRAAVLTASPMQLRARHEYVPRDLSGDGMMKMLKMTIKMMMGMMEMMGMANLFKHPLRVGDARSLLPALPPEGKKKLKRCSFFWILYSATIMLCIQLSEQ